MLDLRLDHRMSPAADGEPGCFGQRRLSPAERLSLFGVRAQHIQRCERERGLLQRGDGSTELAEQGFEQRLLTCKGALLGGERLVLEGLQFRGDVPLGILQRLPAPIVVRHAFGIGVRDFDVETVNAVVLDLDARDAGTLTLASLKLDEERTAAVLDFPQLVERGIVAARDDVAIAKHRRWLFCDRPLEQCRPFRIDRERPNRSLQERRATTRSGRCNGGQTSERIAKPGKIARPRGGERDARRNPFEIDGALQLSGEPATGKRQGNEFGYSGVPRSGNFARAQWGAEPLPKQPAAGRRRTAVEERQQRRRSLAAQRLGDFQIAAGGGIQSKMVADTLDSERSHVSELSLLRGL